MAKLKSCLKPNSFNHPKKIINLIIPIKSRFFQHDGKKAY